MKILLANLSFLSYEDCYNASQELSERDLEEIVDVQRENVIVSQIDILIFNYMLSQAHLLKKKKKKEKKLI